MKLAQRNLREIAQKINKDHVKKISSRVSAFILASAIYALPLVVNGAASAGKFTNPINTNTLDGFMLKVLDVVVLLGAIVVIFMIILAGFKYVTANGDEKKITSAHHTLGATVIGAAIVLGAKVIASAIQATVNELNV